MMTVGAPLAATSAPGLGLTLPHLHRDWATSAPRTGILRPLLRRYWAHPSALVVVLHIAGVAQVNTLCEMIDDYKIGLEQNLPPVRAACHTALAGA